jgi:hypothetical protein
MSTTKATHFKAFGLKRQAFWGPLLALRLLRFDE